MKSTVKCLVGSAAPKAPTPRRPLPLEKARELFTPQQLAAWPRGYLPTAAPAYFLKKEGVTLKELMEAREDIRNDKRHELQRDLAMDYQLWCRSAYETFAASMAPAQQTAFRRIMGRASLPDYADVVGLFGLPSLERVVIEAESTLLPGIDSTVRDREAQLRRRMEEDLHTTSNGGGSSNAGGATIQPRPYPFTSYAKTQDSVMKLLQECRSVHDIVKFYDFPTLRNLLHMHHDSTSHLRFLAHRTGDDLLPTQQFVAALAQYLRERWERLPDDQKRKPIITLFGNGRLGAALNNSGMLPVNVFSCREPSVATRNLAAAARKARELPGAVRTPRTFYQTFPVEDLPVSKVLEKYEPTIVLMEQHMDRDFTAEARGYYTVREVLMLGRVDGPGMGSFSYPWLSFGCAPSADTYWIFNEKLQRQEVPDDKSFMPTDPPYIAQGYSKVYVDSVSKWMIGSNDTPRLPHQYRCVSFRRVEEPQLPADFVSPKKVSAAAASSADSPTQRQAAPEEVAKEGTTESSS
jgi:hypothetical protein